MPISIEQREDSGSSRSENRSRDSSCGGSVFMCVSVCVLARLCVFACVCWHSCVCSCMNKSSHSVSNALIVLTPLFFGQIPSTVSCVSPQPGVQVQKKRDCVCWKEKGERGGRHEKRKRDAEMWEDRVPKHVPKCVCVCV